MTRSSKPPRHWLKPRLKPWLPSFAGRYADLLAVVLLVTLTLVAEWNILNPRTLVGTDAVTQFYPWYSFLGETLRSGELPGWNPYQFSGTPFAADPLSGWTYLPAMVFFTLLPLATAAKAYLFFHPLLAGLGVYALGRALRMNVAGAALAAVAYEYAGYIYVRNVCCFAFVGVVAWLPITILGAEMAIRSRRWLHRGLWWGVSGLALSQILASWLGQGSYYALLALGGYVAYRTLLFPPDNIRGVWSRISGLFMHGAAVLVFGFGLAAAGVLPRLEYNSLSNLSGGYPEDSTGKGFHFIGGWNASDWKQLYVSPGFFYIGAAVLALALVAPLVARSRFGVPYFTALALATLTLSGKAITPLHSLLYLLPSFQNLQPHYTERALVVFYLGAALLAGATVTGLGEYARRKPSLIALPILAGIFIATRSTLVPPIKAPKVPADAGMWEAPMPFLLKNGIQILPGALLVLAFVLMVVAAYALFPPRPVVWRGLAAALLVVAVFVDLHSAGRAAMKSHGEGSVKDKIVRKDLSTYYTSTGAATFLRSKGEGRYRYFAYNPGGFYTRFTKPGIRALEAENRATAFGLQSTQGYNAVRLASYDKYIEALNRQPQNYHGANILPSGFGSPLLDLLNIRYVTVPINIDSNGVNALGALGRGIPIVYRNSRVVVLENKDALPRTWIVHSARQTKQDKALQLLGSGDVNPRETALLESKPPSLVRPNNASADKSSVTDYGANDIKVRTNTGGKGLLVLSEVYYPAWKAYVDGKPVPLYRADQLLRAVPVPSGKHTVELRYESQSLRIGLAISLLTSLALVAVLVALIVTRLRRPKPDSVPLERTRKDDS